MTNIDPLEELHPAYEGLLREVVAKSNAGSDMSTPENQILLARMLNVAPPSYYARLDAIAPGDAEKWREWALDRIERHEHAEFFRCLALLREGGDEGMRETERVKLIDTMLRSAPPRYAAAAEEVIEPFLPKATHVTDAGEPVYSLEQVAEKLGRPVEEVHSFIDEHVDPGRLYRGPVHRLQ